jgi:hypothetical protein
VSGSHRIRQAVSQILLFYEAVPTRGGVEIALNCLRGGGGEGKGEHISETFLLFHTQPPMLVNKFCSRASDL